MILQREIAEIAQAESVTKLTIYKDWVLGHFLDTVSPSTSAPNFIISCVRS